jgi:hypothetical protein
LIGGDSNEVDTHRTPKVAWPLKLWDVEVKDGGQITYTRKG